MREIIGDCPLGSKCYETKELDSGEMIAIRCPWYVHLTGKNPQGGDVDENSCAISWMPILQVEHSLFERQTGAAVEGLRNSHNEFTLMVKNAQQGKLTNEDIKS